MFLDSNSTNLSSYVLKGGFATTGHTQFHSATVSGATYISAQFAKQHLGEIYFDATLSSGTTLTIKEVMAFAKVNITESNGILTATYGGRETTGLTYKWYTTDAGTPQSDDWTEISGETGSYLMVKSDYIDKNIMAVVSIGDKNITSNRHIPTTIRNVTASIDGLNIVGETLSVKLNTDKFADIKSYSWEMANTIGDEQWTSVSNTDTLTISDNTFVGKYIRCQLILETGEKVISAIVGPIEERIARVVINNSQPILFDSLNYHIIAFDPITKLTWQASETLDFTQFRVISENSECIPNKVGEYIRVKVELNTGEIIQSNVVGKVVGRNITGQVLGIAFPGETLEYNLSVSQYTYLEHISWETSKDGKDWKIVGNRLNYKITNADISYYIRAKIVLQSGEEIITEERKLDIDLINSNIARGKAVEVSSTKTGDRSNVTDGNTATTWYGNNLTPQGNTNVIDYLIIDLGKNMEFDTLKINQHNARISTCVFSTSTDKTVWTEVANTIGDVDSVGYSTISLSRPYVGRYLKMEVTALNTFSSDQVLQTGIKELEIYNIGRSSPPIVNMLKYDRDDSIAYLSASYSYIQLGDKPEGNSSYEWFYTDGNSEHIVKSGNCSADKNIELYWDSTVEKKDLKLRIKVAAKDIEQNYIMEILFDQLPLLPQVIPIVSKIDVNGDFVDKGTVNFNYQYEDRNNDEENGSTYIIWGKLKNSNGWEKLSSGSCNHTGEITYTIKNEEVDGLIKVGITPRNDALLKVVGIETFSEPILVRGYPIAFDVRIGGRAIPGETLEGLFTYYHQNGTNQSGNIYKWYVDNVATDVYTKYYKVSSSDVGKQIVFEVTPGCSGYPQYGQYEKSSPVVVHSESNTSGVRISSGGGAISIIPKPAPEEVQKPKKLNDLIGHWAESEILKLYNLGIAKGVTEELFMPSRGIKRAELIALVARVMNLTPAVKNTDFKDVDENDWFAPYVYSCLEKGIISKDTYFRPMGFITREEMAKVIANCIGQSTGSSVENLNFIDKAKISDWAFEPIAKLVEKKLIYGFEDQTFRPKLFVDRAQATVVISRFYSLIKGGNDH
jgi:hypothetical protein